MYRLIVQLIVVAMFLATLSAPAKAKDPLYGDLQETEALEMFDFLTEALLAGKALDGLNENYKKASQNLITKIQTANAKYNERQEELRKKYNKKDYCVLRSDMTWDCTNKDRNAAKSK